ncbi:MAG TPA: histidine kinase dimerization/phospho-acceptor domain-containing protein, partial [Solirubrobacteraceae bacterium]|nr:histidine kinase dimerization/phospho-acceptor domain-containing protein [Solirubrobacteraceae bacterium]
MRIVPTGRALGLRARIVGVVMVTAVSTLAIAAVTLLGPLEHSLRNAEKTTLSQELNRNALRAFERLPLDRIYTDPTVLESLRRAIVNLQKRLGATAYVFASPGSPGLGIRPLVGFGDDGDSFSDVVRAFRTGKIVRSFGEVDGTEVAREAIPFTLTPTPSPTPRGEDGGAAPAATARVRRVYVLAVRRPIGEIPGAARAINRAFLYAALAGLALSLVLGIPISARLVRRLRRLREAALKLTDAGTAVEVPVDRVRDEVGDLSRALWIMQQRLGRQEQARREFVATASHELRTPLASLEGMLELLRDDLGDERPDLEDARALVERA